MEEKSRFLKAGVREFTTNSGKTWYNIEIHKEDFNTFPVNSKGFVKLTMRKRKEVWEYGDTHFLVLNDYKPKSKEESVF